MQHLRENESDVLPQSRAAGGTRNIHETSDFYLKPKAAALVGQFAVAAEEVSAKQTSWSIWL